MKNLLNLAVVALLFNSCTTKSQPNNTNYFEGNIKFKNEYVIKTDKVIPEYLDKIFGKTADLYFKEGNYLEIYDGGFMREQLYRRKDNKSYIKNTASDTLRWYSCEQPGQKIIKYEINPKKEKILGIMCDEYVTVYENKTVTFYFNSDTLKLNPEWYKQFTLTNKNINTERMKSLYLKYKLEYADFIYTVTATSIAQKKIDNKTFDIKPKAILIKDTLYN